MEIIGRWVGWSGGYRKAKNSEKCLVCKVVDCYSFSMLTVCLLAIIYTEGPNDGHRCGHKLIEKLGYDCQNGSLLGEMGPKVRESRGAGSE